MKSNLFRFSLWAVACMMSVLISCSDESGNDDGTLPTDDSTSYDEILEGEINKNKTLSADKVYLIRGFVYVYTDPKSETPTVLTIEPGTVLKGEKKSKGSLIIEPGSQIIAKGTKDKPIVFTSNQPAGKRAYGDWGGLVICGNATVNASRPQIEGGPRTIYGGTNENDNSGILEYVRIEFPGYPFRPNQEINGLTFGGVGKGTSVSHIQVSYSGDDSYEWFGGDVNCSHLIAYKGWDDEFDTDYGYSGKLQFLLGVRDPKIADTSKSNGFESDNDASGSNNNPITKPVFSNVTLIGPFYGVSKDKPKSDIIYTTENAANGALGGSFQAAMHIRRNSSLKVYNSVFTGWPYGLFLDKANAGATVKNVIFAGMWKNFNDTEGKEGTSQSYFETASLNNKTYDSTNEIIRNNADYMSVDASKIEGASFDDSELDDEFFEKVNYKGALDGTVGNDWTKGWTNFDPQNTDY